MKKIISVKIGMDSDFRNEWLIAKFRRDRYILGLKCIPLIYLEKYSDLKFLKKLKRYLIKLLKWQGAFSYKLYRYHTHEACILGEEMKYDDTQFNESIYDIDTTVDYLRNLLQRLQEYSIYELGDSSYKEYIKELEFEKIFG